MASGRAFHSLCVRCLGATLGQRSFLHCSICSFLQQITWPESGSKGSLTGLQQPVDKKRWTDQLQASGARYLLRHSCSGRYRDQHQPRRRTRLALQFGGGNRAIRESSTATRNHNDMLARVAEREALPFCQLEPRGRVLSIGFPSQVYPYPIRTPSSPPYPYIYEYDWSLLVAFFWSQHSILPMSPHVSAPRSESGDERERENRWATGWSEKRSL